MPGLVPRVGVPVAMTQAFCSRRHVEDPVLFGSVLRGAFGADSDSHVLIRFKPDRAPSLSGLDNMHRDPAPMSHRPVDLVTRSAIDSGRSWIRRRTIPESSRVVCARNDSGWGNRLRSPKSDSTKTSRIREAPTKGGHPTPLRSSASPPLRLS